MSAASATGASAVTSAVASAGATNGVTYVSETSPVVCLSFDELCAATMTGATTRANASDDTLARRLDASIEAAYGEQGLGILVVRGVPEFIAARERLLRLAPQFAKLPDDVKALYERPPYYLFGWSHGKEQLAGKPDFSKGSYYNNPQYDEPSSAVVEASASITINDSNVWPAQHMPDLEPAFKALGQLIISVGERVALLCDRYVHERVPASPATHLHSLIRKSRSAKARLLHYFPAATTGDATASSPTASPLSEQEVSSWCGWHNDHGSLTGLCSAMFFNADSLERVENTDPSSGLYIRSRQGQLVKAVIPPDCIAFQLGEAEMIHSGGVLQATPHCVRASSVPNVSRETFAVFMQPDLSEPMPVPDGRTVDETCRGSQNLLLPPGVPPLASRWNTSMTFGEFTMATMKAYHPA